MSRTRLVLTAALAGLAALRFLVSIVPDTIFDVDPLMSGGAYAGIGPGVSVLLDGMLLLLVAFTLEVERRGEGIDWVLLLLFILPLGAMAVHGSERAIDAWRGLDWCTAAAVGVALAHLVRTNDCRSLALSILIGAVVVAAVRGGWQLFEEHPQTVSHFLAHKAEVLQMNGWSEGSAAALTYERRLMQPEATAWVGFSNIASGVFGAAAVFLFGAAVAANRRDDARGVPVGLGLLGAGMVALVLINASKGAIAASVFGGALVMVGLLPGAIGAFFRKWLGVCIGLGCLAVVGVIVARGAVDEDFLGDRSVLFRSHYLDAGLAMIEANPLVGVGPSGFQELYPSVRPLRSPETPASAHSMWLDWVVSFGIAGSAWVVLMGLLIVRRVKNTDAFNGRGVETSTAVIAALVVFGAVLGVHVWAEGAALDPGGLFVRVLGVTLAVMTAALLADALRTVSTDVMHRLALCGAAVIVVQAQLEMLAWQPGSVAIVWAFVGVAGTARAGRFKHAATGWPWILAVVALVVGIRLVLAEAQQRRAVEPLYYLAWHLDETSEEEINQARVDVAVAISSDVIPDENWWDTRRIRAAVTQFAMAGDERGLDLARAWATERPSTASASMYAAVARSVRSEETRKALREAIVWRPLDAGLRLQFAELLLEEGDVAEATVQLARAKVLNDAMDLDPIVQFTEEDLRRIAALEARLN